MTQRPNRLRRLGCAAALFAVGIGVPYLLIAGIWVIGGGNHRTIEHRLTSPDGRFEVRVQNDVRGSIQPIEWIVYVKPAATRSDDPAESCAVADARGEDGWRGVTPLWRGDSLELRWSASAPQMPVRRPLTARPGCAPVPIRIVEQ